MSGVNLPSQGWTAQGGLAGTDLGVPVVLGAPALPTVAAAMGKELLLPVSFPRAGAARARCLPSRSVCTVT